MTLLLGDCLEQMKSLADESVDSVVTDPPYGLNFMGKKWDYDVPSVEIWREVLRVLKPGGHVLSFGGTRTYHRMVVNMEDAGFEIRDQILWVYGSGFPKSQNVEKAILKLGKNPENFRGWGTALKPANEPICLARKPISEKTIAANVLKHGTGAINVDGCRISTLDKFGGGSKMSSSGEKLNKYGSYEGDGFVEGSNLGRWPANIIFDEEAAQVLDEQSGTLKSGRLSPDNDVKESTGWSGGSQANRVKSTFKANSGGASRFFYVAKASKRERGKDNNHPTVKPIKLMTYLVRLITPPGGVVLDPFMGSGSTGIAAKQEGFDFIGIEMNEEYFEIAKRRIVIEEHKQGEDNEHPRTY